ncbi:ABC transporter ATP-binding protein [Neorhizobium galegae]|uniref:ABC transporter ATP-binding protein n=1 Tax=Neorhizobium galegae TaxID=399 RepID=UPI0012D4E12C|nr:ABC transporter ATP-binding protein [Neorhizobium galegae]KAB1119617.1 ABC transporter ATP-binding protein [Neorhizobium galegae]MCQ1810883.1 ABC transporter ATP-binding protein [Neorhizobium galegae]MCQ1839370.1 ABC transporter ATP-binding protein [Neorhizobium galegae]
MDNSQALLKVENLRVSYRSGKTYNTVVKGVSFDLGRERLGIVGESGSGKSTIGRALLKLLPTAKIEADRMDFGGIDLISANEKQMLTIRGRRISMILQDPKFSLNPVHRVGDQIAEAYRVHYKASAQVARQKTLEMLEAVKIRDPERVFGLYPHEVSGGMGQRIMIAMMLIPEPQIIIADEPTSALDVTVRMQVLNILNELVTNKGIGLIMISHDLNLVRNFCDRVLVMRHGEVVEERAARDMRNCTHPYTQGLLAAQPHIGGSRKPLPVLNRQTSSPETKEVRA